MCADWSANEEITADKLNNRRGFKSRVRAHTSLQLTIPVGNSVVPLDFNVEDFDSNNEFDCPAQRTGTASATSANHLVDTGANQFVSADVGRWVYNSTDKTYAQITAYNSVSDVTISADIMASGEGYRIYGTRFTAKVEGYYQVFCQAKVGSAEAEDFVRLCIYKNGFGTGTLLAQPMAYVSSGGANASNSCPYAIYSDLVYLDVDDYLEFGLAFDDSAARNTSDTGIYFTIYMVSEA